MLISESQWQQMGRCDWGLEKMPIMARHAKVNTPYKVANNIMYTENNCHHKEFIEN